MDKFLTILLLVFLTSVLGLVKCFAWAGGDLKTFIVTIIAMNLLMISYYILEWQEINNILMKRFLFILVGIFLTNTAVFVRCRIISQIDLKKTIAAIIFLNVFAIFLCFFILFP